MANSIDEPLGFNPVVLPFAVKDRWTVTIESEMRLVKVRHRTRWYVVARRKGHDDRSYWCASRAETRGIAGYLREGFRENEELEWLNALYLRMTDWQRAQFHARLEAMKERE